MAIENLIQYFYYGKENYTGDFEIVNRDKTVVILVKSKQSYIKYLNNLQSGKVILVMKPLKMRTTEEFYSHGCLMMTDKCKYFLGTDIVICIQFHINTNNNTCF